LPALRERREDLPLLVEHLLARLAPERPLHLDAAAMQGLLDYDFPGNIRELRNLLERAMLMADGDSLRLDLPRRAAPARTAGPVPVELLSLEEVERRYVRESLAQLGGDRKALARRLGISERTLYRKLAAED
jgi:two-component system, NtrC family, response regulator HydG